LPEQQLMVNKVYFSLRRVKTRADHQRQSLARLLSHLKYATPHILSETTDLNLEGYSQILIHWQGAERCDIGHSYRFASNRRCFN